MAIYIDKAKIIKDRLKMRDVLSRYGFEPRQRMRCPLHNGYDLNFSVSEHSYMCYSHCGSGDVLTFVQKLFNLSFPETLKKIDVDFNLNLFEDKSFDDFRKSYYQYLSFQAQREREHIERKDADAEYISAIGEWLRLDKNRRIYAPKTIEEEWHPLFIEALKNLPYQSYMIDCAEAKIRKCRSLHKDVL